LREYSSSVIWNLFLITAGALIFALGLKGIALHHKFISGGLFGTALLINYLTSLLSPGILYFILNIPIFIVGWLYVSRRFFFYSLYAMVVTSLAFDTIDYKFDIHNQLYAAVACGVISGAGTGIILRSLGSNGGLDVIAVILNQKLNLGIGKFFFFYNCFLFSYSFFYIERDLVIVSLIMVFIASLMVDYVLALFSRRKVCFIISSEPDLIAREILHSLHRGATFLKGQGAYTGKDRTIVMAVIDNIQLKKLEEIVFGIDPESLFIVENTFSVLGSSFSRRKLY